MSRAIVSHHLSAVIKTARDFDGAPDRLVRMLARSAESAELTPVAEVAVAFEPDGASAVVLLAESHVAVHYWPEHSKMTVDIHVCDYHGDNVMRATRLAELLAKEVAIRSPSWRIESISG